MKLKNKKASESLVSTKLIVLILVVLVVIAIIVFAMRSDTLSWIKNLPGFKEPADKEIDLTTLTPDQLSNMGYVCGDDSVKVGLIGPQATGNFVYQMAYDVRYLYLFDFKDKKTLTRTGLMVDVDDPKNIKIESISGINILIGNIIERRLTLTSDMKNKNSASFKEVVENKKLVTPEQLKRLDFSYTVGGSLICKKLSDVAKEGAENPVYYKGYNLVPDGDLLRIYKDGSSTKFYVDSSRKYIKLDIAAWKESFFRFGKDRTLFTVDSSGKIDYTRSGAEVIPDLISQGYGSILEDLRKSKLEGNNILPDKSMDNLNIIGKILYETRPNTYRNQFYIDLTQNGQVVATNLYYDKSSINALSNGDSLMLSSAGKIDDLRLFSIVYSSQSSSDENIIGVLHLNLNEATYNSWKSKDYPDLIDYSTIKELDGATFDLGKLIVYK